MKCLQANDVVYAYQNKSQTLRALNGVSADSILAKMYATIRASGRGTPTLLSLLPGLDVPSAVSITCTGAATPRLDPAHYRPASGAAPYPNFTLF